MPSKSLVQKSRGCGQGMHDSNGQRIPIQVSRGCVVASIQVDLNEEVLRQFRTDLLHKVQEARTKGVILDVSGLALMDLSDFDALRRTMDMAEVMGAKPILCGLNAGMVSALIDLGADADSVKAARNLDDAFSVLEPGPPPDEATENKTDDGCPETDSDQEYL